MPGTINQKTGRRATIIDPGVPIPGMVEQLLAMAPPPPPPQEIVPSGNVREAWHRLNRAAQDWVTMGAPAKERHSACFKAAASIREAGLNPIEAERILMIGAQKCWRLEGGIWQQHPLQQREVQETIRKVWSRTPSAQP